ncbi:MAG: BMC domain-containing protein [Chloroflexota bacterium]
MPTRGVMPAAAAVVAAIEPALGLLEIETIPAGIEVGDAMAKRSPIEVIRAGTVHPGKYLVLVAGEVADVEEALEAGREIGGLFVRGEVFLPNVHPEVVSGVRGERNQPAGEAIGIIETATVTAIIVAADAGLKGAQVRLLELRLADDLGGKGYLLFDGIVSEVEAAVEIAVGRLDSSRGCTHRVIARLHAEMAENLAADPRFAARVRE